MLKDALSFFWGVLTVLYETMGCCKVMDEASIGAHDGDLYGL